MTKSELREMIRQTIREELDTKKKLTESTGEMDWDSMIETADNLLLELVCESDNADYDDGDGYWQTEYDVWCNRKLYYTDTLNNSDRLQAICDKYSAKLPNVEFYFYEDDLDEDSVSEIGYTATRLN